MSGRHMSPEGRAAHAERMRRLWADPEYRAMRSRVARECMTRLNSDPEFQARRVAGLRESSASPEYRKTMAEVARRQWADPIKREMRTRIRREMFRDPAMRERFNTLTNGARWGLFWCPDELKRVYLKLRKLLGAKEAQDYVRGVLNEEFARKARYRNSGNTLTQGAVA
jgi:hypothetical protein